MSASACSTCRRPAAAGDAFCAHCGRSVAVPAVWTPVRRGRRRTPLVLVAVAAGLVASTLAVAGVRAWRAEPEPEPWTEMEEVAPTEVGTSITQIEFPESYDPRDGPQLLNSEDVARVMSNTYPPIMRDAGVSGEVEVRLRVLADGTVDPESVEVLATSHTAFAEVAPQIAAAMRFIPAENENGEAVEAVVTLPIRFQPER